jgi:hypothetical protein
MDCNTQQTEFLQSLEASINHTTPQVRYQCETDRLLFAIPNLIKKLGILKEWRIYLCDLKWNCLTAWETPEESVKQFRQFVADLLDKKTV